MQKHPQPQGIADHLSDISLETGTELLADKGYYSAKNLQLIEKKGLKNGILKKATKSQKLTTHDKQRKNIGIQIRTEQ